MYEEPPKTSVYMESQMNWGSERPRGVRGSLGCDLKGGVRKEAPSQTGSDLCLVGVWTV